MTHSTVLVCFFNNLIVILWLDSLSYFSLFFVNVQTFPIGTFIDKYYCLVVCFSSSFSSLQLLITCYEKIEMKWSLFLWGAWKKNDEFWFILLFFSSVYFKCLKCFEVECKHLSYLSFIIHTSFSFVCRFNVYGRLFFGENLMETKNIRLPSFKKLDKN